MATITNTTTPDSNHNQNQNLTLTCHCGRVTLTIPPPRGPLNECLCSICHRYGALWAYYHPDEVSISGATDFYAWRDREIEFHRCKECGCMTHWAFAEKVTDIKAADRIGVNCRMVERGVLDRFERSTSEGPE